ncbi:uncharacterized protein At1g27050 isoform X2 [Phalaenopsis equestris]|uniref:uncharacterized protein At1g27050 isoform X2 n=1 Tax=Phalaenopsis equestris TaxID=78828 RepID=UPI0009E1BC54|nr:uncharacterized protein At1g27050 isoform X2 [Phalaenopsis equestris]
MERRTMKRGNPNLPSSLTKRLRLPLSNGEALDLPAAGERGSSLSSPSSIMVTGLPLDCTVLELKSRFEMYGPISRTRIDENCSGYVTFRSDQAADAAMAASIDPTFGIAIRSSKERIQNRLQVDNLLFHQIQFCLTVSASFKWFGQVIR